MMHTGSAESLRHKERRGREIAQQIAALLNEAEALAPGGTHAAPGQVLVVGAVVRRRIEAWEVDA
ncbi:hypothetical protein ABZ605_27670 [Streptomyces sp. NPDC012765]|uniref:hypothetical protein n=1 Tax=Streptomyces sp. NPDC012765 TaxID=3155249 RepID=UPI0033DFEEA6